MRWIRCIAALLAVVTLAGGAVPAAANLYNLPAPAVPAVLPKSGVIPARHMAKFQASGTPTVCFVGDSTWSTADYVSGVDSLAQKVSQALISAYPDKTITFKDFAIGGRMLSDVPTVLSSGWPGWYSNHSSTWNSYVAAAGCTAVLVSFGINDTGSQSPALWKTFQTNITAYSTVPDLVLFTNMAANPAAGNPYNLATYQAGYLTNAALQRTMAELGWAGGVAGAPAPGLVDNGRLFAMSVLGFDPAIQPLTWITYGASPITGITTSPYTLPQTAGGDFDLSFSFTNGSGWYSGGTSFTVTHSSGQGGVSTAGQSDFLIFYPGSPTYVQGYYSNGSTRIVDTPSGAWLHVDSNSVNTIRIILRNSRMVLYLNSTLIADVNFPRAYGPFTPQISWTAPSGGTSVSIVAYATGSPLRTTPIFGMATCYGSQSGAQSGNGVNHLSSACLGAIYQRAIDATTWR